MLVYLIFFIIVLISFPYLFIRIKHKFWYLQPVSHYYNILLKQGYISSKVNNKLNNSDFNIQYLGLNKINNLCKLLQNNYIPIRNDNLYYSISSDFLKWTLNIPYNHFNNLKNIDNKLWRLGIYNNNQLIGSICSRPMIISLNNQLLPVFYVDYLCISRKYRKQNLAQVLISHIVFNSYIGNFKAIIFRNEIKQLPFKCITSYDTRIIDMTNINHTTDSNNFQSYQIFNHETNKITDKIIDVYQFYTQQSKLFQGYQKLEMNEFIYYIKNLHVHSYFIMYKKIITSIIILFNNQYLYHNHKCLELFCYLDTETKTFNSINNILHQIKIIYNYKYFYINDIGINNRIINKYKCSISNKNYIHLYNFHLNNYIPNNKYIISFF